MYELLKNAKLLIVPDWIDEALKAYGKTYLDIQDQKGLESILSEVDVNFYKMQLNQLSEAINGNNLFVTPVEAVLESLPILHMNFDDKLSGKPQASGLSSYVKINALYGKHLQDFDFFNGADMLEFLPRRTVATMNTQCFVDPYVEYVGGHLFVLKFSTGFYDEQPMQTFIENSFKCFMGVYGFDEVCKTVLFDYLALMPEK